ncbi:MAG: leucine-rich repeat protein [Clostridia bacterium]|nr:leucine-rich repeat protein [Clostridia bacterium]
MKKIWLLVCIALLLTFACVSFVQAESVMEDELPEGVYIYTPAKNKFLPWTEADNQNVFQVIGLAPNDSTVNLSLRIGKTVVWNGEVMSEGNGYFSANIPAADLDIEPEYTLEVESAGYSANVVFYIYRGTLTEFAADPLHLALLEGLTPNELYYYEAETKGEILDEESFDDLALGETMQTGPNEYRNKEYSYVVDENGNATLTYYYQHKEKLVLPTTIDGYKVTGIRFPLFSKASGVKSVHIPSQITEVSSNPFLNWISLTAIYVEPDHPTLASVNGTLYSRDLKTLVAQPSKHPEKELIVPMGTTTLGEAAFFTSTVRTVDLPESLRTIGTECFAYARRMSKIRLPDSVRVLETGCLRDSGLTSLMIPSKAAINSSIVSACPYLKEITVMPGNETVKSVDGVLFSADGEILYAYPSGKDGKRYKTPKGTVKISSQSFRGTVNLESVELTEGIEEIEWDGFGSSSIKSITLPNSLTTISQNVFSGSEKLTEIIVRNDHPTLSSVKRKYLYSKDHTIFYCYPAGLKDSSYTFEPETEEIEGYALSETELKSVVLPDGLKKIGHHAFYGSHLKSVYVPGSVTEIGTQAFSFAYLEYVALDKGVEKLSSNVFNSSLLLQGVSVPDTVTEIGELAFLKTGNVRIFTTEGSFMHQYAIQNQLKIDVEPGNYEAFTESVKNSRNPLRATGYIDTQEVEITAKEKVNIRQKPNMDSRRVGRAEPGAVYTVVDIIYENDKVAWYLIEMEDGTQGYISGKVAKLL